MANYLPGRKSVLLLMYLVVSRFLVQLVQIKGFGFEGELGFGKGGLFLPRLSIQRRLEIRVEKPTLSLLVLMV